jgi:hypothetical protein
MPLRTFTGRDGRTWNVWNVVPTLAHNDRKLALSSGMVQGWLCFESGEVKRRIIPVPDGWEGWSEAELDGALDAAIHVDRRARETVRI